MLTHLWSNGQSCVAVAALLFSASSLFVKLTSGELPVLEICALSSGGCALILFLASWLPRNHPASISTTWPTNPAPRRTAALVAARSCLGAVTILCYYAAVEMSDIRDATALFFTSPLFTLVFECLVQRRVPSKHSTIGAILTAAGALMISHTSYCMLFRGTPLCPSPKDDISPETVRHLLAAGSGARALLLHGASAAPWASSQDTAPLSSSSSSAALSLGDAVDDADAMSMMNSMGLALAVVAAATNALAFITIKAIGPSVPALTLTFWHHTTTATAAVASQLALMLWFGLGRSWFEGGGAGTGHGSAASTLAPFIAPSARDSALVAGVLASQLAAQTLLNRGFSLTTPTRGAAINVLQVVFSFVWDIVVFGNMLQVTSVAGGMLIVSGVLVQTSAAAFGQSPPPPPLPVGHDQEDEDTPLLKDLEPPLLLVVKSGALPALVDAALDPELTTVASAELDRDLESSSQEISSGQLL